MFWVHEKIYRSYLYAGNNPKGVKNLLELFATPIYRVKDTGLTYRQINSLDQSGMLPDKRRNPKGWRTFNFKDIVYLAVIEVCREYGLKNEQLQELKADFYTKKIAPSSTKNPADDAILMVLIMEYRITVSITREGKSWLSDVYYQAFIDRFHDDYLNINLSEIIKREWNRLMGDKVRVKAFYKDWQYLLESYGKEVSDNEKKILSILRSRDYISIKINKKGKDFVVYRNSEEAKNNITEMDLLEIIKSKKFADIQIVKRKGKVQKYKVQDVFKF